MKPLTTILAAAAVATIPTGAWAADFTLDVPVHLENLPAASEARVFCQVSRVAVEDPYAAAGANLLGRTNVLVPHSGGRFDGTVTVEINNTSITPSTSARSYSCWMQVSGPARTGATFSTNPDTFREVYETATGQTLERITVAARGNLP